jgi:nucleotide-binding universal stress UspA family protein
MKTILVTTDFSANSKRAIRFALQLASQNHYKLIFYNVANVAKNASAWDALSDNISDNIVRGEKLEKLEKFIAKVHFETGLPKTNYSVICNIVHELGLNVANQIMSYANEIEANYICTSARGHGTLDKLFGTVASDLILKSEIPIFIIPSSYRLSKFDTVCYASDTEAIDKELAKVLDLSKSVAAKITVLHFDYAPYLELQKENLLAIIKKYESKAVTFVIKPLNPKYTLNYHIRKDVATIKPSLVVLFTKQNRKWFDRLFAKSNSTNMSFNTKTPLLIFRK